MLANLAAHLVRPADPPQPEQSDRPALASLREAQARLAALDTEGERDRAEAASLRGVLDRRTALRARRQQLRDAPNALARDLADVERALTEIDEQADSAKVRIDALEARLTLGARRMSETGARLPVLELDGLAEGLAELTATFAPVKAEVLRHYTEAVALVTRMRELQTKTRRFEHAAALSLMEFRLPAPFDLDAAPRARVAEAVRRLVAEMAALQG